MALGGTGSAAAANVEIYNFLKHADLIKLQQARSACAAGDPAACAQAAALEEKDKLQQEMLVLCRSGGGADCQGFVLSVYAVALSSYSGSAAFLGGADVAKFLKTTPEGEQVLKILAPEGWDNLTEEQKKSASVLLNLVVRDPTGLTGLVSTLKDVGDGDPAATLQLLALVTKMRALKAASGLENLPPMYGPIF